MPAPRQHTHAHRHADDRLQTRYPKLRAEQAEDDCVVAGRASFVDLLGVVKHRRSAERGGGGAQQRPARPRRRLAGLPRELARGEPFVGARAGTRSTNLPGPAARCAQASATPSDGETPKRMQSLSSATSVEGRLGAVSRPH